MARYTPDLLASLKQAYEDTDEPMHLIADRHEIGITTLQTLVRRGGWAKRSERLRDRPASAVLFEENEPPFVALPPPAERAIATEDSSRDEDAGEDVAASCTPEASSEGGPPLSPAARLEALIVRQIAAEEADLDTLRRMRGGADRCARTLVILGQALTVVQKLRAEEPPVVDPDDIPRDIDTFREALAARINAFVDAHTDPANRGDDAENADEEDEQSWPTSGP